MTPPLMHRASIWWLLAIGWASTIYYMSSQSDVPEPGFWMPPHADKIIHALLYALLAGVLYPALRLSGAGRTRAAWVAMILASLYGATDEWHQASVMGRSADVWDWVADTVGANVTWLMARYESLFTARWRFKLP